MEIQVKTLQKKSIIAFLPFKFWNLFLCSRNGLWVICNYHFWEKNISKGSSWVIVLKFLGISAGEKNKFLHFIECFGRIFCYLVRLFRKFICAGSTCKIKKFWEMIKMILLSLYSSLTLSDLKKRMISKKPINIQPGLKYSA